MVMGTMFCGFHDVCKGLLLGCTPRIPNHRAPNQQLTITWRIIPVSKWLITMVNKSPKDRVVGPLPNGHSWLINGGDPNHLVD